MCVARRLVTWRKNVRAIQRIVRYSHFSYRFVTHTPRGARVPTTASQRRFSDFLSRHCVCSSAIIMMRHNISAATTHSIAVFLSIFIFQLSILCVVVIIVVRQLLKHFSIFVCFGRIYMLPCALFRKHAHIRVSFSLPACPATPIHTYIHICRRVVAKACESAGLLACLVVARADSVVPPVAAHAITLLPPLHFAVIFSHSPIPPAFYFHVILIVRIFSNFVVVAQLFSYFRLWFSSFPLVICRYFSQNSAHGKLFSFHFALSVSFPLHSMPDQCKIAHMKWKLAHYIQVFMCAIFLFYAYC